MTQCQKCGGRADAFLCRDCGQHLRSNLQQIPWLAEQLAYAHTKQVAMGERAVIRGSDEETPVPFNSRAHEAYDELRTVCMRWVRDLCDQAGIEFWPIDAVPRDFIGPLRPEIPARNLERVPAIPGQWRMPIGYLPTTADLARWLDDAYLAIMNSEDAGLCITEIDAVIARSVREINRRIRVYCGPCPDLIPSTLSPCNTPVYADWDDNIGGPETFTKCARCRALHDTQTLRDRAFDQAHHYLMTKSEIFDILANLGEPLSPNTFKQWRRRGKLKPRGWMHEGRVVNYWIHRNDPPVFKFGDVRALQHREHEAVHAR